MSRSRKLLFWTILLLGVAAPLEFASWQVGHFLAGKGVFYEPQEIVRFHHYMAKRDPLLGWVREHGMDGEVDASGSRRIPAFPEPGDACVSLYGDSMTWASEVDAEHSWANALARRLGCRVANYGVGGYGTDQALLRFESQLGDEASVVVLAHLAENVLRNVNQYRRLLYTGNDFGLKPRFVLGGDGKLELVPLPTFSAAEFEHLTREPELYLPHEYFRLHAPAQVRSLRFPYTFSILRAFADFRVRAELARRPSHTEFYAPDHPSRALPITVGILARFDAGARSRGMLPLPMVIPTGTDFEYFLRTGGWAYQPLLDGLSERGVEVFNAGPAFLAALPEGRHVCDLIFRDCSGHFNEEGYALLAGVVAGELERRGYDERIAESAARSARERMRRGAGLPDPHRYTPGPG